MSFSNSAAEEVLRTFIGQNQYGILSNCYIGLSSTPPDADGGNFTEPSADTGYARAIIGAATQYATYVMTATGHEAENTAIIYFPESLTAQGTFTHFGLFRTAEGGEAKIYGALDAPVSVPANYVPLFRVGAFKMTLV